MSGSSEKDRELDAYLSGESPLSRAYRESGQELPPPHVDAQILAEAHRAGAGARKRPSLSPFTGSWMVPASVTAVVFLAVSVVVLLPQEQPGLERQRDRFEDAMAPADAPAAGKSVPGEVEQAAPAATYAPAPPQPRRSAEPAAATPPADTSDVAPATTGVPTLEQQSVLQKEQEQKAEPMRPDAASGGASALKRSRAQHKAAETADEGVAGRARSEAMDDAAARLARIEALIEQGELEAAREALAEYRRAYPGSEVPQHISAALE